MSDVSDEDGCIMSPTKCACKKHKDKLFSAIVIGHFYTPHEKFKDLLKLVHLHPPIKDLLTD